MNPVELARGRFQGRTVGIVGLGREGMALGRFMLSVGATVVGTDDRPLASLSREVEELQASGARLLAGGAREAVLDTDYLFVSPGVPLDHPLLKAAARRGLQLYSEPDLVLELSPALTVGITGSSGKSTTTSLVAAIASATGRKVFLGGNIGTPLVERLGEMGAEDVVVQELSSFQLELVRHSPHVAMITNITPNHLDRHGTMEAYVEAKRGILRWQGAGDWLVLNADDDQCVRLADTSASRLAWFSLRGAVANGAYREGSAIFVARQGEQERVCERREVPLLGEHNLANVVAAVAVAGILGIPAAQMRQAVLSFRPLPHRLEKVGTVAGADYYNDSIATSPERAIAGMRAFESPVLLLTGGRDKHLPWDSWMAEARRRARLVILFGELGALLEPRLAASGLPYERHSTLEQAVQAAYREARPGEVVLFSPGGTSFDAFRDFEERGECFRALVTRLERSA